MTYDLIGNAPAIAQVTVAADVLNTKSFVGFQAPFSKASGQ
jgi:hypothetical protein